MQPSQTCAFPAAMTPQVHQSRHDDRVLGERTVQYHGSPLTVPTRATGVRYNKQGRANKGLSSTVTSFDTTTLSQTLVKCERLATVTTWRLQCQRKTHSCLAAYDCHVVSIAMRERNSDQVFAETRFDLIVGDDDRRVEA